MRNVTSARPRSHSVLFEKAGKQSKHFETVGKTFEALMFRLDGTVVSVFPSLEVSLSINVNILTSEKL